MARFLLVAGGCRGLELARELSAEGHAVRITTRDEANRERIEAAGAECVVADPDVVGTLRYALDNVTVLMWLLGPVDAADLHGSRWEVMLWRTIETTGNFRLRKIVGSGMIRLVWKSSPPNGGELRSGNTSPFVGSVTGGALPALSIQV